MQERHGMHASIAERFAYGTPLDRDLDDSRVYTAPRSSTALIGRILLSVIFLTSGFMKLTDPASTIGYMQSAGIPNADTLVYVAGAAEVLGGLALLFGFLARLGALGLFIYLIPTTLYFHNFWALEGADAQMQMANFMKNLAVMGGLLMVVAHGPGAYSIDGRIRRPLQP
jgi:putative oxidoreductase